MLVITRKSGEGVVLQLPNGEEIDVMVTAVKGTQVRLGFEMPDNVELVRSELFGFEENSRGYDEEASYL